MTLLEKYRKLYPNGKLDKDGIPTACPWMVEGLNADRKKFVYCGNESCRDCWNREYKKVKNEKN